jgi:PleD family two-component response regulator
MSGTARSVELRPGIWRISAPFPFGSLEANLYLLAGDDGSYCLVDSGPVALQEALIEAVGEITPPYSIKSIVLLDDSPLACSALRFWPAAGFAGRLFADWRAATSLSFGGSGVVQELWNHDEQIFPGTALSMRVFRLGPPRGPIALLHEATGLLFSGRLGSSLGKNLPELCMDQELRAQREFAAVYGYDLPPSPLPEAMRADLICPRFGSAVPGDRTEGLFAIAEEKASGGAEEYDAGLPTVEREMGELRRSNYELKLSMVTASDDALRDPASGLYGKAYADAFIQSILGKGREFSAAFIRVDRIKELNRRLGARAADQVLRDLATLLGERTGEGFIFRWTGPVLLLILEGERTEIFGRMEAIRSAVETERRFAGPITVSVALVGTEELGEGDGARRLAALQALARERLKLLDRKGGNNVLDRSDLRLEDRSLVLALDSNPLFLDYLVESLDREGFRAKGAARGGEALELMDSVKPELVIAEAALPQFDAFQIRLRMRASADLHDIPFILLTDAKTDELVSRAHSLSIFHVFEKPVSMVELSGIARNLLARSEDGA